MTNTGELELRDAGRPYASPLRRAQAESTRATVIGAAAALFVRDGYCANPIKAIAAEAGTSVETVYTQGSTRALLLACVEPGMTATTGRDIRDMLVVHDSIRRQFGQAPALEVFGIVMYGADPQVIRGMLSHAPLVPRLLMPRLLMPRLAPRAYTQCARRLHGTATP